MIILVGLITLEILVAESILYLHWISIVLWSIEMLPQIWLNIRRKSVSGESYISIFITFIGKLSYKFLRKILRYN